jgi:hypothetical protein
MIIIFNLDDSIFFMLDNCEIKNWHFIIKLYMFIKIAFILKLIKKGIWYVKLLFLLLKNKDQFH